MRTYRPVTPSTRPCHQCGTQFVAKRRDARYCSSTCRVAAHRGRGEVPAKPAAEPDPYAGLTAWETIALTVEERAQRIAAARGLPYEQVLDHLSITSKSTSPEATQKYLDQLQSVGVDVPALAAKVTATHERVVEILETVYPEVRVDPTEEQVAEFVALRDKGWHLRDIEGRTQWKMSTIQRALGLCTCLIMNAGTRSEMRVARPGCTVHAPAV